MTPTLQHSSTPVLPASSFEFATAGRILFGAGRLAEVGPLARQLGRRSLVVIGQSAGAAARAGRLRSVLAAAGLEQVMFPTAGEPTVATVRAGVERARAEGCDTVIGFGGGSVMDCAKAVAALLTNGGDPLDYLEVIGRGQPLTRPAAPCIAIPTTAGSGAEVTRNAVLGSPEHRLKVSMRSPWLLPRFAVVDPELTRELPAEVTAYTGLDALTQLIEPFVSARANPLTDGLCREGLRRSARALRRACAPGDDLEARQDLSLASLCGGLALANAGLGAVHGFAAPLGGTLAAAHGALCAALLPHVMAVNVRALSERMPDSGALARYAELAGILTGCAQATSADGVGWVRELCAALGVRALGEFGLDRGEIDGLVAKAAAASSMRGNPIALSPPELREVLERAW